MSNEIFGGKVLWDVRDIQTATGLSRTTVYQLLNREDMPVVKIGKRRFMNASLFRAWLDAQAGGCEGV